MTEAKDDEKEEAKEEVKEEVKDSSVYSDDKFYPRDISNFPLLSKLNNNRNNINQTTISSIIEELARFHSSLNKKIHLHIKMGKKAYSCQSQEQNHRKILFVILL